MNSTVMNLQLGFNLWLASRGERTHSSVLSCVIAKDLPFTSVLGSSPLPFPPEIKSRQWSATRPWMAFFPSQLYFDLPHLIILNDVRSWISSILLADISINLSIWLFIDKEWQTKLRIRKVDIFKKYFKLNLSKPLQSSTFTLCEWQNFL